ncbi:hypothetical protein [Hwanghaeella sp.]|uniref:hypothetical protein n=1 Tax=Hwanghaeella sp. TaxID=2605943 RepID=UPI003CCBE7B3
MSNPTINVTLGRWKTADFDKKPIRKVVRRSGLDVQKTARRLVNRKGKVSKAGQYPGRRTGELFRSIRSKQRNPFVAVVKPQKTAAMKDYYPLFLFKGTKNLDPRGDVMGDALEAETPQIVPKLERALVDALKWVPLK